MWTGQYILVELTQLLQVNLWFASIQRHVWKLEIDLEALVAFVMAFVDLGLALGGLGMYLGLFGN